MVDGYRNDVLDEVFADLRRCSRCILPETFPGISFDGNGVCNYCREYKPVKVFGEDELRKVLDKYRGKGKGYDCVVPVSGGRDSSYVLYTIVERFGMRALALTVDSGGITKEGYRNIEKVTSALGVDHVWLRDEKQIRLAKENTKIRFWAWLKKPSINTIVPVLNTADKTMNLRIFVFAHKNGIPLVIGGNNIGNSAFEQEHFKTGFMGVFPDERGLYSFFDRVKLTFLFAWEFLNNYYNYHLTVFKEYVSGAFVYFFEDLLKPRNVDTLGFYDYVYWREDEVVSTVKKLGWEGAADTTATWRIDDAAYPLIDYVYLRLVGFNEFDEFYSKLIREGQISRDEGLKRCMVEHAPRYPSILRLLEELEVSKEDLDKVLDSYRAEILPKMLKKNKEMAYRK